MNEFRVIVEYCGRVAPELNWTVYAFDEREALEKARRLPGLGGEVRVISVSRVNQECHCEP